LFSIDQITSAGNVDRVRGLHIGAPVEVRLDPEGRAAVYADDSLLGWPSRYADELELCLKRGYRFPGRIVDEGGMMLPDREVQVTGVANS
jgi:hypothetical protein